MRTAGALLLGLGTLAGLVYLLSQEDTALWQLGVVGGSGGLAVGVVRWQRQGALIGLVAGVVVGLLSPILYLPFWLVFTLPPHPKYDF